jgi:probable phosphoglycerate mutase
VLFDRKAGRTTVTTFLLIRHAQCDPVGRAIAGRQAGVHLNTEGRRDAEALAMRLRELSLAAIYSSPLERAIETAEFIAARQGLLVKIAQGLNEVDFGNWTGKSFAELDQLAEWKRFNTYRSRTRIPGGEMMSEVLNRSLVELERLNQVHPDPAALVAVVSHGDVLRAIVSHALGMSLDLMQRFELSPASVSILDVKGRERRVLLLNSAAGWPYGLVPSLAGRAMQDAGPGAEFG